MLVRTVMLVRCGDPAPTQLGIAIPWMAVRFVCVCVCVVWGWGPHTGEACVCALRRHGRSCVGYRGPVFRENHGNLSI